MLLRGESLIIVQARVTQLHNGDAADNKTIWLGSHSPLPTPLFTQLVTSLPVVAGYLPVADWSPQVNPNKGTVSQIRRFFGPARWRIRVLQVQPAPTHHWRRLPARTPLLIKLPWNLKNPCNRRDTYLVKFHGGFHGCHPCGEYQPLQHHIVWDIMTTTTTRLNPQRQAAEPTTIH